ncbi:MAG: pyruvate, phosphate dikinase [Candidatus Hodarchaeales archaeon]|jgi:pyruvate,orthophosphate dikinase
MDDKLILSFKEGNRELIKLLGEKGSGLAEMTQLGLLVPPGFIITTTSCSECTEEGVLSEELLEELWKELQSLEDQTNTQLGDASRPLLVSVRSGTGVSMPGILETVLNIGLNDETVKGLAKIGDERFAYDTYCRLLQMYGVVIREIPQKKFQEIVDKKKIKREVKRHAELHLEDLKELVTEYKSLYMETGNSFPQDPKQQLIEAIEASINVWKKPETIEYCIKNNIPKDMGLAITVQAIVFGNLGVNSATGHVFTRNPSTGEKKHFGDFLPTSQADDIFKTLRMPIKIDKLGSIFSNQVFDILTEGINKLEQRYKDMQFVEFVIQEGKLFFLQTARGLRTGVAAGKIAYDMVQEGLIDKETAIKMVSASDIEKAVYPRIDWYDPERRNYSTFTGKIGYGFLAGKGLPAAPGAASGHIVFSIDKITEYEGDVIFVTDEITQDNFQALFASQGIITTRGGMTSEAAMISRQEGNPCIVSLEEVSGIRLEVREHELLLTDNAGKEIVEGEIVTIDGFSGDIFHSALPITTTDLPGEIIEILKWCEAISPMEIKATAHVANEARVAFEKYGAKGLGLVRSEHHFFEREEEKEQLQKFALAINDQERLQHLVILEHYQIDDFVSLLRIAKGKPISIKLADVVLQDFLPPRIELYEDIQNMKYEMYRLAVQENEYIDDDRLIETARKIDIFEKLVSLQQQNPMLGLRGCRLGIIYPMLVKMQVTALFKAVTQCLNEGIEVQPEILVPLVSFAKEFSEIRSIIDDTFKKLKEQSNIKIKYQVGCLIETPRAALVSGDIARHADFLLIGSNDMAQNTLGFSRVDTEKFLTAYLDNLIYKKHPFISMDKNGVGKLLKICIEEARKFKNKDKLKIGITGEQAEDPETIKYCYSLGLDYISCSPYKIPVAYLVAAQAKIESEEK